MYKSKIKSHRFNIQFSPVKMYFKCVHICKQIQNIVNHLTIPSNGISKHFNGNGCFKIGRMNWKVSAMKTQNYFLKKHIKKEKKKETKTIDFFFLLWISIWNRGETPFTPSDCVRNEKIRWSHSLAQNYFPHSRIVHRNMTKHRSISD